MILFALSIFLSAFLLFQIQPMIGRFILPWFGGTPAVWSTLMLVFQVLLTGGYATWLVRRARHKAFIHITLLLFAFIVLSALAALSTYFSGALFSKRNFYGVIRVQKLIPQDTNEPAYVMSHGITVHGMQFIRPEIRELPTTYYVRNGGRDWPS